MVHDMIACTEVLSSFHYLIYYMRMVYVNIHHVHQLHHILCLPTKRQVQGLFRLLISDNYP